MTKTLEEMLEDVTDKGYKLSFKRYFDRYPAYEVEISGRLMTTKERTDSFRESLRMLMEAHCPPPPPTAEDLLKEADSFIEDFRKSQLKAASVAEWQQRFKRYLEQEGVK